MPVGLGTGTEHKSYQHKEPVIFLVIKTSILAQAVMILTSIRKVPVRPWAEASDDLEYDSSWFFSQTLKTEVIEFT